MHGFFCFGGSFSQGDPIFLGSVAFVCITLKILDCFLPSNILKFECKRNIYRERERERKSQKKPKKAKKSQKKRKKAKKSEKNRKKSKKNEKRREKSLTVIILYRIAGMK